MAQFDVHRNPGPRRDEIPFVVVVQSPRLDSFGRKLVVPLLMCSAVAATDSSLNPRFRVEDLEVFLHPLEMVSVAVGRLGEPIGSLRAEADRITAAIDIVISRAWR